MGFGSFAGGLAGGLSGGVDIAEKLRAIQAEARKRAASRALGNSYGMDDVPAPPPIPMTGQTPMPGQQSMPAGPPPGGMNPDPMMGLPTGGAPMPPQAAPPMPPMPGAGPPPMAGPAPMPPVVAPPPAAPMSPSTGAEGTNLSGTAAPSGQGGVAIITDANDTIKSIAAQVKKANPGIDPETLFEATRQRIENMKGVRNEVKDYMVLQTEYAKLQHNTEITEKKLAQAAESAAASADAKRDVAETNARARLGAAETNAGARTESARIGAGSRVTVGAGNNAATRDAAGVRADATKKASNDRLRGTVYNAASRDATAADTSRVSAQGRVDAASAGMGGKPTDRYSKPRTAAALAYKSAAEVAAAYKAGKIDRNTAASILKKQFGAQ